MDITQILLNGQSQDGNVRRQAEESLVQLEHQNFPGYVQAMVLELSNPAKPIDARRLAGLMLKNALAAKEAARKEEHVQRWVNLDPAVKSQTKSTLLATLADVDKVARHTAAQVIGPIASIEIPRNEWPELIPSLLENMQKPSVELREATLETLGFVCEEVAETHALAQEQVNSVLTAVVQGMNKTEPNNDIRLIATRALYNALEFAHTNFENEVERNYIMTVVCEATLCEDERVRQAALECLVAIASFYYDKLAPYMTDIFNITAKATKEDKEPVALQAIELWSTICDEEISLQEEYVADSETTNFHFIKQAVPVLVPMLLETLKKQEEDQDTDETAWNLSMSGGTCLGLVARTVGNDIVPIVVPFVQSNINNAQDWRCREAATFAFGSILEGPDPEQLAPLVTQAFPFLLSMMADANSHVKHTTAWTLSRIFEFFHGYQLTPPIVTQQNLQHVLQVLDAGLKDDPHVAAKVCGAIYFLAQGFEGTEVVSPLSPYIQGLMQALLIAAERDDAVESGLRTAAYEALNNIIRCSTEDSAHLVVQLSSMIMQKLQQTLEMTIVSQDDRERQGDVQALLCGVLQVIIQKLSGNERTKAGAVQYADQMMSLFLRVFQCRSATVHEEAMMAIGAMAYATGPDFAKYMNEVYPFLEMGLQNFEEYQVCAITVGVVGDISRAIEEKIAPYCDGIMKQLLTDLSSETLHRSVKPAIFSCMGDIALAIGAEFAKYLPFAMPMLQSASELTCQQSMSAASDELADYNNQLRAGIFEAYAGIFQAFKGSGVEILAPFAEHILAFIENVAQDKDRDESVTRAAIGVLGDLADTLGANVAPLFASRTAYQMFLSECLNSKDDSIRDTAAWAHSRILAITSGSVPS